MFFRRAVELKPDWALPQYNLGVVFLQTKVRSAALAQYIVLKSMSENIAVGGMVESVKATGSENVTAAGSATALAEKLYAGIYRGKLLVVSSK